MGEGCGHLEEDMCMYLNENARTYIKTGAHREVSKEGMEYRLVTQAGYPFHHIEITVKINLYIIIYAVAIQHYRCRDRNLYLHR